MSNLDPYFFNTLPDHFYFNDTYKDGNGKGLLQRYIEVFQEETEEYLKDIEGDGTVGVGLSAIAFPLTTKPELLNHIAAMFGNPPDTFQDVDFYRRLLHLILRIHKYKGTLEGIQRFFGLFGVAVSVDVTLVSGASYDEANTDYDDDQVYDGQCSYCANYILYISDPRHLLPGFDTWPPHTGSVENLIRAMTYLMPINGVLTEINYNGTPVP